MGGLFGGGGGGNQAQQMQQQNQQMLAQQNAQFAQQQAAAKKQQEQQALDQMTASFHAFQNQQMTNQKNQALMASDPQMAWRNILSSASTPTEQAWAAGQLWQHQNQGAPPSGGPGNPFAMGGQPANPVVPPALLPGGH